MGLMNFIKSAGEKIFGGSAHATQADALTEHVKQIGGEDVKVEFVDGKVSVTGTAKTQEEKEKILLALGNVEGVEAVEEHITVPGASGEGRYYTVKKGDTLSKIAKEYYHNANEYNKIFEANKPLLTHPDKIYPGQMLRIPE